MTTIHGKKNKAGLVFAGITLCCGIATSTKALAQNAPNQVPLNEAPAQAPMAVFKEFAKYPPESRPLSASNWDLLHPWSVDSSFLPMLPQQVIRQAESLRASGLREEELWRTVVMPSSVPKYQFEMNRTVLTGTQDELVARLTVTLDQETGTPVRIHVTKAELIGDDSFGSPQLGPVPFVCELEAAVCTFRWKAPGAGKQYWGTLDLVVTANVEGMSDEFVLRQPFYSSPIVAGKFTGRFHERLDNGSLVISAGVEVQKRMACFVSANLFSVDKGLPTHHVDRRMIMDPSMKVIPFTFFGKIFRDYGHEGSFRMQDLKAQCENLSYPPEWFLDSLAHQAELQAFQSQAPATTEPSQIYFAYTTHRYAAAVFSDQEWQSPDKNRKLEVLRNSAVELNNPAMEIRKRKLQPQSN